MTGRSPLGSSLGAFAVNHATTGSHSRKSVPYAEEGRAEKDTFNRPTSWPNPVAIYDFKYKLRRGILLGMLSVGDYFTTRLTYRRGWVVAHVRGQITESILVEWADTRERVELPGPVTVCSGWWEVIDSTTPPTNANVTPPVKGEEGKP